MSALDLDILSREKHPFLTDAYEFVDTQDVIKELDCYGFVPVKHAITKARNPLAQPYAKHTVAFQREDAEPNANGVIPQLHMINSYNGSTSLRFEFGMLRLVCSNGLVMRDGKTEGFRMKHDNIHTGIDSVVEQLQNSFYDKQVMIQHLMLSHMSKDTAIELARRAIVDRFDRELEELDYNKMVTPTRYEDSSPNAWNIFNIIQERIIKGDKTIKYRGSDRNIKDENDVIIDTKPSYRSLPALHDFEKSFSVNKNLFDSVVELAS